MRAPKRRRWYNRAGTSPHDEWSNTMIARVPLVLEPQPEGGYTVTSPLLPELVTEGDTVAEALANAQDAFAAVAEIYEDRGLWRRNPWASL